MKLRYVLFLLVCAGTSAACHKQIQPTEHTNGKVLPGVWELRALQGEQMPYDPNHYKPGNGDQWKFTETEFTRIYKDSAYASGTYTVTPGAGTDLNTGRKIDQFVFNGQPAESFELRDDTLRFYYGLIPADGVIKMYVKVADKY